LATPRHTPLECPGWSVGRMNGTRGARCGPTPLEVGMLAAMSAPHQMPAPKPSLLPVALRPSAYSRNPHSCRAEHLVYELISVRTFVLAT
jgi:hypothetical protein